MAHSSLGSGQEGDISEGLTFTDILEKTEKKVEL